MAYVQISPSDPIETRATDWGPRPACRHCGHVIAHKTALFATGSSRRSPTGWSHEQWDGWEGIRCPGRLTGAEPALMGSR